jgi:hypothetical protein
MEQSVMLRTSCVPGRGSLFLTDATCRYSDWSVISCSLEEVSLHRSLRDRTDAAERLTSSRQTSCIPDVKVLRRHTLKWEIFSLMLKVDFAFLSIPCNLPLTSPNLKPPAYFGYPFGICFRGSEAHIIIDRVRVTSDTCALPYWYVNAEHLPRCEPRLCHATKSETGSRCLDWRQQA